MRRRGSFFVVGLVCGGLERSPGFLEPAGRERHAGVVIVVSYDPKMRSQSEYPRQTAPTNRSANGSLAKV